MHTWRAAWPLWVALTLALIWLPAVGRGFCGDDFLLVPVTLSQFLADPLWGAGGPPPAGEHLPVYRGEGRPVSTLTFALLPASARVQHAVSLLLYLGCVWLMWRLCRRQRLAPSAAFLALSSFFHPAFLWNVTWIAHRYDLLVIAFVLAAMLARRIPVKVLLIGLSSGSKPPLFFQNVVFAWEFVRRRHMLAAGITLLCMIVFGLGIYLTRYSEESTVVDSLYTLPALVSVPLRLVKVLEGVLYVFAPVPMFASTWSAMAIAAIVYVTAWIVLLRPVKISYAMAALRANPTVPALAAAMSVPFLYASEVRITGAAAVMAFLWIAGVVRADRARALAIGAILFTNLIGIFLNYGAFRSEQYDIRAPMVGCDYYSQPAYMFVARREAVRRHVLTTLGVRTEFRTFP